MPSTIRATKPAGHRSIRFVLQKLGIPTEIGTKWLQYYDNPIDAMAQGDSVHIMPGVDKTRRDYGAALRHCTQSQRRDNARWILAADSWQKQIYDDRKVVSSGA